MKLKASLVAAFSLVSSFSAYAQTDGSMDYGPPSAAAIPVGGGGALLLLGLMLAGAAYWMLRRGGTSGHMAAVSTLAVGALVASLSGAQIIGDAYGPGPTLLNNPDGGTVPVFPGYTEYQNATNVPLQIKSINPPTCPPPQVVPTQAVIQRIAAYPVCTPGSTTLQPDGICSTDYCSEPVVECPPGTEFVPGFGCL